MPQTWGEWFSSWNNLAAPPAGSIAEYEEGITYTVYYHQGFTGRAQPLEMMLAQSGKRWKRAPWSECNDPTCIAAPAVALGNGPKYSQTLAAAAYLGDECGFAPPPALKIPALKLACDVSDVWAEGYAKRQAVASWKEAEEWLGSRLLKFFKAIESQAGKYSGTYMFGERLTYADFLLANGVLTMRGIFGEARLQECVLKHTPVVAAIVERVLALPAVAKVVKELPILYPTVMETGKMPLKG